jgi:hypothetical protein
MDGSHAEEWVDGLMDGVHRDGWMDGWRGRRLDEMDE